MSADTKRPFASPCDTTDAAIRKDAFEPGPNEKGLGKGLAGGRQGLTYWIEMGYIPSDVGIDAAVSMTLDYSHADYAISRAAQALGHKDDAAVLPTTPMSSAAHPRQVTASHHASFRKQRGQHACCRETVVPACERAVDGNLR